MDDPRERAVADLKVAIAAVVRARFTGGDVASAIARLDALQRRNAAEGLTGLV